MIIFSLCMLMYSMHCMGAADAQLEPRCVAIPRAGKLYEPKSCAFRKHIVRLHKAGSPSSVSNSGNHIFELDVDKKSLTVWYPMDAQHKAVMYGLGWSYVVGPGNCVLDECAEYVCARMHDGPTVWCRISMGGYMSEHVVQRTDVGWQDTAFDVSAFVIGIDLAILRNAYNHLLEAAPTF